MRGLSWIIVLCLSVFLVSALPNIITNNAVPEMFPCEEFKVIQKTFTARSGNINIGLVCPLSSRITISYCTEECTYATEGYKTNGALAFFGGFVVGESYQYQCHTCTNSCALTVNEKEEANLNNFFQGVEFRVKTPRAGFDDLGIWKTAKGDAGAYNVVVETKDGNQWEEVQFCVEVLEIDEPAQLTLPSSTYIVKEGQTITLEPTCVDPEGEEGTLTYSGWMDNASKQISYDDSGTYQVKISCYDSSDKGIEKSIKIVVLDTNRPPIIENIWEE